MDLVMVALRVLHIGAGVMWVGAAWMLFLFVRPTAHALGAEVERTFTNYILRRRRLATTILVTTVVTTAAGLTMLYLDITRYGVDRWFGSSFGLGITAGASAAIVSFLLGPTLIVPMADRLEKLTEAGGNQAEVARVGARLSRILGIDSALLLVAVVLMASARYL